MLMDGFELKGNWKQNFFRNEHPIVLELGCGKGEYTVGLARHYPQQNFIGIDRKGARMWRGAKTSFQENMKNVAFVRTRIELIVHIFGKHEVDEIWITFPDPQPKDKHEKKRLTSRRFQEIYRQLLVSGGKVHLKTDSNLLYKYTLSMLKENNDKVIFHTNDLYNADWVGDAAAFTTHYEKNYLEEGKTIKYVQFTLG